MRNNQTRFYFTDGQGICFEIGDGGFSQATETNKGNQSINILNKVLGVD